MDSFNNMSHTVIDSHISLDDSWVTVMCRATQFHISVSQKALQKSRFETEYSEMVAKALEDGDGEDHDMLCEWIVDPCLPYFRQSTTDIPREITFADFYCSPTHHLKVIVSESSLGFEINQDCRTMNASPLTVPSMDIPPFASIPRTKASDVRIIGDPEWDYHMSEIPEKVFLTDRTCKFFKPADNKKQLLREVDMYLQIRKAGLLGLKIANLHSIVVSDDEKLTIGLLLDLIQSVGDSLYKHEHSTLACKHNEKWKQQITDTVEQLHAHDIVWGDVHPGNIVIDHHFDAWIVDFGGGSIVEFVPRKKAGTKEGDWHGVAKVFDEWLIGGKKRPIPMMD